MLIYSIIVYFFILYVWAFEESLTAFQGQLENSTVSFKFEELESKSQARDDVSTATD